jgi:hypothetical protein
MYKRTTRRSTTSIDAAPSALDPTDPSGIGPALRAVNERVREEAEQRGEKVDTSKLLERITLHEARHTYASLMIAAVVNAKPLSTYMCNANISITLDRYGHLMPATRLKLRRCSTRTLRVPLRPRSSRQDAHHRSCDVELTPARESERDRLENAKLDEGVDRVARSLAGQRVTVSHIRAADIRDSDEIGREAFCDPAFSGLLHAGPQIFLHLHQSFDL